MAHPVGCGHTSVMHRLLLFAPLLLVACANNGGAPPPGDEVSIESVNWGFIEPCFGGENFGAMLRDVEDVQNWMAPCGSPNAEKQQQIVNTIGELDDTRRLVAARVVLGGCTGDWWLRGLFQEDALIHIWVMVEDTSLNAPGVACTADVGWAEGYWIAAEGDVAAATAADLVQGIYNPSHPGTPAGRGS